tara:strand:- start:10078 stop:13080 length:3003 start_codon:yes stop_codon:yes gene_type:complete
MTTLLPETALAKADIISELTEAQKVHLLKTMCSSREGDLREQSLLRQGKGWFQIAGMGHEALAAMALGLNKDDYCFPYYRDRAFCLERGLSNHDLGLAFFAKKESSSAGRQLPGHYSDSKLNIWSHLSPVGSHLLPACGTAWGLQMDGKSNVVYASIGEAATRQGDFYEAICFAKERNLPIVFVVHDGRVSISTKTEGMTPLAIGTLSESDWQVVDGTDVGSVYNASQQAYAKARAGQGPSFIWCQLERLASHSSADDHRNYRTEEELTSIQAKDPIALLKADLIAAGALAEEEIQVLEASTKEEVTQDYQKAEKAADPKPGDEHEHNIGEIGTPQASVLEPSQKVRMADAVNTTFRHLLDTDERTCFFGEDVEDPLGGVFKLTKGLSTAHPDRVFNSPLAESTILGVACGLASYGKRPIFELQFIDFIFPAWNQLINNLANLRWRSYGDWSCPCVIYAPYGGYLPGGGIWHSQAHEGALAHFPGMHIVIPSTPEDAAGLITSAMSCHDPVLVLLPKHLLWASSEAPSVIEPIPLGKAKLCQEGTDVTLVTWGNCIEITQEALALLDSGVSVEVLDLRSIVPWDKEAIVASLKKTKRLVVVQEDNERCSVGQMILSTLVQDPDIWNDLVAPPVLVSKDTVQIGFNPIYEYSALPDKERVLQALQKVMSIHTVRMPNTSSDSVVVETPSIQSSASASTDFAMKIPNLGEGLREARIVNIIKQVGEEVSMDDPLCEIETDKAVFPVESPVSGILKEWKIDEDDKVEVAQTIALIETEDIAQPLNEQEEEVKTNKGVFPEEVRKSLQAVLPTSLSITASWKAIRAARQGPNRRITATAIIAWCVTQALMKNPSFRRTLQGDSITEPLNDFDLGVAVALEDDVLETTTIPQANEVSWAEFPAAYQKAVKEAKDGTLPSKARTPLILSSMHGHQMRTGCPIVVPPAVGVLFVGEAFYEHINSPEGPVLDERVNLCLSFDHRFINGAGGARFLHQVKTELENFEQL